MSFVFISISSFSQEVVFDRNRGAHNEVSSESKLFSFGLLSFKAVCKGNNKVVLNWSTATEAKASHFIMQRSKDGVEFDDAAVLFTCEGNGAEKMDYRYTDNINAVKNGLIFYRLKIVGSNGASIYSAPVMVRMEKIKEEMHWLITGLDTSTEMIASK
jgi:threonyl-tRNA synthetase